MSTAVEEDGDEVFLPADHCCHCRLGFKDDKAVYAPLAEKSGFLCCTVCGCSYGAARSPQDEPRHVCDELCQVCEERPGL